MCTHTFSYNSPQLYMHLGHNSSHTHLDKTFSIQSHDIQVCESDDVRIPLILDVKHSALNPGRSACCFQAQKNSCTVNAVPSRLHQISVLLSSDNHYSYKKDFVRET